MDFQAFKEDVAAVKSDAETLADTMATMQDKTQLDSVIDLITNLLNFLSDTLNIKALSDYNEKAPANKATGTR